MAIKAKHGEVEFGVGDVIRVHMKVIDIGKSGKKERIQIFEGMVIKIGGRGTGKSFVVRRIGSAKVGIEMIFPLQSPNVAAIEVKRSGLGGVKRSKLYYTRDKSKKEIEKIYSRNVRRVKAKEESVKSSSSKKAKPSGKKA